MSESSTLNVVADEAAAEVPVAQLFFDMPHVASVPKPKAVKEAPSPSAAPPDITELENSILELVSKLPRASPSAESLAADGSQPLDSQVAVWALTKLLNDYKCPVFPDLRDVAVLDALLSSLGVAGLALATLVAHQVVPV